MRVGEHISELKKKQANARQMSGSIIQKIKYKAMRITYFCYRTSKLTVFFIKNKPSSHHHTLLLTIKVPFLPIWYGAHVKCV